ncbi:MAG: dienelactone hydrolase family protein, partial [Okeania sp. SIO3B3]|nr:dienelactone hydrolase family protein [Okeania sp. SIO3B3]
GQRDGRRRIHGPAQGGQVRVYPHTCRRARPAGPHLPGAFHTGHQDRHTPEGDRQTVAQALEQGSIAHQIFLYEAEHTFMRDDGYRYDSAATTSAWSQIIPFFNRVFDY